jgi:hypothetical protein
MADTKPGAALSPQEIALLRDNLDNVRRNLGLIQDRIAQYVFRIDVPLQTIREEQDLLDRIAELERQLEGAPPIDPGGSGHPLLAETVSTERVVPDWRRWLGENWSLLGAIVAALLTLPLSPFGVIDTEIGRYVALLAATALGLWYVWRVARFSKPNPARVFSSVVIVGVAVGWGYYLYWTSLIPVAPEIQTEWQRLKDDLNVDLGLSLKPAEEITSSVGTKGQRQVFQKGEVYLHDDQAHALYGPILEHYTALGGIQEEMLGFPTSGVRSVTSVSGAKGTVAEFESNPSQSHTFIYASSKGIAQVQGWISDIYQKNGGPEGWLGFPLADPQDYPDSDIQMFEYGYIVYYRPQAGEERDSVHPPVIYPYLASHGTFFDVRAEQSWQSTGVRVQPGDLVTIIQVDGTWTIADDIQPLDANGYAPAGLYENRTLPSVYAGVLIGRIGEDAQPLFPVGRWSTFTSQATGLLYLAMNDSDYGDNSGLITVRIMVEHPK